MLKIFLKKGLVADRMTLCAAGGCPSFKTRVTSINVAAAPNKFKTTELRNSTD